MIARLLERLRPELPPIVAPSEIEPSASLFVRQMTAAAYLREHNILPCWAGFSPLARKVPAVKDATTDEIAERRREVAARGVERYERARASALLSGFDGGAAS